MEYEIELDFLPREFMLFQYARVKSREALVSSVSGLYRNVLREISEKEEKNEATLPWCECDCLSEGTL